MVVSGSDHDVFGIEMAVEAFVPHSRPIPLSPAPPTEKQHQTMVIVDPDNSSLDARGDVTNLPLSPEQRLQIASAALFGGFFGWLGTLGFLRGGWLSLLLLLSILR